MNKKIRWGIMGPGFIATKFAESLASLEDAECLAVGSRSGERAEEFARQYGFSRAYGSYEELVRDQDVDIIYIATPHNLHYECSMLCLEEGRAVLCEKPLTVNAEETRKLIEKSYSSKVFFMEGMWTRYLPAVVKIRELVGQGAIGEIQMVRGDFGFRGDFNPKGRLFNPELAGGALLDVGVYPISFASMLLGSKPSKIYGVAQMGETGIDEQNSILLGYDNGKIAALASAVRTQLPNEVLIVGTDGFIRIPEFWMASTFEINIKGNTEQVVMPFQSTGYAHEAREAMECMREGRIESSVMPHEESLDIMKIMDAIRGQWGLKYPFEA